MRSTECRVIEHAPPELVDDDHCIMAVRIDGPQDTRGKARAFFASEWGDDFTTVRVRKAYYRLDTDYRDDCVADGIPEPYDGWPWRECGPGEHGHPYWQHDRDVR